MQIIQFSDWNISYLYLILFTFFLIIESYSLEPITAKGFNNVIVLCFFGNLLKPFSGLIEYFYIRNKFKETTTPSIIQDVELSKPKHILLYASALIFDWCTTFFYICIKVLIKTMDNPIYMDLGLKGIQIFFACTLCIIILKYKFENHKKGGLIIMGIGLALNFILSLTMESGFDTTVFICQLLDNIVAGIQEVSEKYLMYFEYESPFIILFYEGIFSFVLLLIIFLFDIFLSGNGINPTLTLIKENWYYLLPFSITCYGYNFFSKMINNKLSPTHRMISDTFATFIFFIIFLFSTSFYYINYFIFAGYIIAVFGSIVYNEMIILSCCGLDRDTQSNISERSSSEVSENIQLMISLLKSKKSNKEI